MVIRSNFERRARLPNQNLTSKGCGANSGCYGNVDIIEYGRNWIEIIEIRCPFATIQ